MMGIPVTDHAIVRYLERCKGVDVEAIRAHIWKICEPGVRMGATCIRAENVKFEFANGTVVTVTPPTERPNRTAQARAVERMRK